ncbi:MAG: hypothetical protein WKH64_08300 [Chloroflexia bacterium]
MQHERIRRCGYTMRYFLTTIELGAQPEPHLVRTRGSVGKQQMYANA